MALNRGGRGWQGPPMREHAHGGTKPPRITIHLDERPLKPAAAFAEMLGRFDCCAPNVIDLIEVAGVWMTPEDARNV